jgi:peptidoglycan/LPS O-acetylase OafA/YrhL
MHSLTPATRYISESLRDLWHRPAHQVPGLDGLRALAILLVVGSHFFGVFWSGRMHVELPPMAHFPFFELGWSGVDLFFVLSGYLIGKQLWRERLTTGSVKFKEFILRRGFRIWPLFYFVLTYYALFGPVHPNRWDFLFLTNFARFTGGFDDAWSLATEEQFYIIVPLLLIATAFVKRPSRYFAGIVATCGLEWILRFIVMQRLTSQGITGKLLLYTMHYPIFLHCDALLAGLTIALASVLKPERFRVPNSAGLSQLGLAIFLGASALGVALRQTNKIIWAFAGLGLVYGGLTLWVLWDRSVLSAPFKWRIWYPISRLSYGMYLNNFAILPGVTFAAFTFTHRATGSIVAASSVGLIVGTLVSMGVATVTFVLVERPFLILRDRVLERRVHMHASHEEPIGVATSA